MRKLIAYIIIISVTCMAIMVGCGDKQIIDGIEYDTYGLLNKGDKKSPDIEYRVIVGNVVWSIILCETIVAPIYFIGFSLYEPAEKVEKYKPRGCIY